MNSDLATLVLGAWTASPHSTIQRLDHRSLDVAWKTTTSHLIFVLRHPASPQLIVLQATCTLEDILVIILCHLTGLATEPATPEPQCSRVLDVLAQQIMLSGTASSTDIDLRRLGLETPHQILQASGHTVHGGWETIFEVLGSVYRATPSDPTSYLVPPESSTSRGCPPPLGYLQEKRLFWVDQDRVPMYDAHVDGLAVLYLKHLRLCKHAGAVRTASGQNIALMAA